MGSKKDKKDKKHKSEKKSKKESKSSKKSSKDKKQPRSTGRSNESELASILNTAVFTNPKLLTEIPAILKSLDDGEYVDVYNISKKYTREIIVKLMKHLPVLYDPAHGFYKDSINTNVSEYIVRQLTKQQIVKAPYDLSMSEALASKNVVHKLMELLTNFPDLKAELGGLLGTIIDGNSVQLDSLENEGIRDGLEDLFRAIGMENSSDGYALPEGRRSELVREVLEHLNNAFDSFSKEEKKRLEAEAQADICSDGENDKAGGSSSSSGSGSEDSEQSDNDNDIGDKPDSFYPSVERVNSSEAEIIGPVGPPEAPTTGSSAGPVKGPSMPTLSDLHSARALIEQQRRAGVHHPSTYADESSEDDGFGPQRCDTQTARALQAQISTVPLGFTGTEMDTAFERAFEAENEGINSRLRGEIYTGEAHKVEDETKREEWILNPGDSKLAASLSGAGLTNRKFQTGKGAKKAAEQMSIQREFQRQQQALQAAQSQAQNGDSKDGFMNTDAVMQDYREKRGESLMEAHLAKKARTASSSVGTTSVGVSGKQQRRAFDREIDMGHQSKMTEERVSKLVQNAKELDDRFDKGSVQKSFL